MGKNHNFLICLFLLLLFLLFMVSCCLSAPAFAPEGTASKIESGDRRFSDLVDFPTDINPSCPDWKSGETILVKTDITLPESCVYERVTLRIVSSNVDIDCNNAVLNGLNVVSRNNFHEQYSLDSTPQSTGIEIVGSEVDGNRLSNISISNCQLLNYVNGVTIGISLQGSTRVSLRAKAMDEQLLRDIAPTQIYLSKIRIIDSHKHGIFINRYITDFSLENSSIKGSGNSGLYLESGSRFSTVKNSTFEGNGFSYFSRSTHIRKPRVSSKARREGIAIDGSRFNTITGNTFKENGDGGIYLYKNCWEKHDKPTQLPRREGASDNLIESNSFTGETVGVWLAERADRNLKNFNCGDTLIHSGWGKEFYRDYASRNIVDNNVFSKNKVGIRVQDNDNFIRNNTFIDVAEGNDIEIGSKIRILTVDPVTNTSMYNNIFSRTDSIVYIE